MSRAEYKREWRRRNPGRYAEYNRKWMESHPGYKREYHAQLRIEVLDAYGSRCACCGETEPKFLAIDHIDGGGNAHRREIGVGSNIYSWLRQNGYPEGFQVLCHNCNNAKGFYGECPHSGK